MRSSGASGHARAAGQRTTHTLPAPKKDASASDLKQYSRLQSDQRVSSGRKEPHSGSAAAMTKGSSSVHEWLHTVISACPGGRSYAAVTSFSRPRTWQVLSPSTSAIPASEVAPMVAKRAARSARLSSTPRTLAVGWCRSEPSLSSLCSVGRLRYATAAAPPSTASGAAIFGTTRLNDIWRLYSKRNECRASLWCLVLWQRFRVPFALAKGLVLETLQPSSRSKGCVAKSCVKMCHVLSALPQSTAVQLYN